MPTKEWKARHRQVTFWFTPEDHARLVLACKGKSVPQMVRDTIRTIFEHEADEAAKREAERNGS